MNHLTAILLKIKKNPGVYIGKKSVQELSTFITGYECALFEITAKLYTFNYQFQEFIQKKYGTVDSCKHWSDIISVGKTHEEAFDLFYVYWNEFENMYHDD